MNIRYANLLVELQDVRRLVVEAVVDRGFPECDADEVAWEVLTEIMGDLAGYAAVLGAVNDHTEYLETMAMATYLRQLTAERQRRPAE